jgi:hypothetical protein
MSMSKTTRTWGGVAIRGRSSRILVVMRSAVTWSLLFLTILISRQDIILPDFQDDVQVLPMDQHPSDLVPLSSIPENERDVIPGVFKYGESVTESPNAADELIITAASITGDYHHPNKLWFQLLGMGKLMFSEGNNFGICGNRTNNATTYNLKPWSEMRDEKFFCRIGNLETRLELMPSTNYDGNTVESIQVWRCPLIGIQGHNDIISKSDMELFFLPPRVQNDLALAVEVIHKSQRGITSQVVRINIPIAKPSIGIHQIHSDQPANDSFLNERHNITLCVVSHANGIPRLNEHIRYHHDIVGIDHIHVGLFTNFGEGNKDKAELVHHVLNDFLFKSDVDRGALSVSPIWDEEFDVQCSGRDFQILSFYQECLYRAKSTSEFVATWDLDEFFLFTSKDSRKNRSLPDFLRAIDHSKCRDWSYVTMRSSSAGGEVPEDHLTGLAILDFPTRGNETNNVWLKSIARTEKCFLNSPHILGSCLPHEKSNISDAIGMHPEHSECSFIIDDAVMVHARTHRLGQDGIPIENGLIHSVLLDG